MSTKIDEEQQVQIPENEMPKAESREVKPQRHYRSMFWPVVLVGVGTVWLLSNLGVIGASSFAVLWRLWPVLLILGGLDLMFGRQTPALGALLGLATVGGVIALLILAPTMGWATSQGPNFFGFPVQSDAEVKHDQFTEPIDNADSADVQLSLSEWHAEISPLSDNDTLFTAEVDHTGEMNYQHSGGSRRSISLAEQDQLHVFYFQFFDGDQYRWDIGLSPNVPIDLTVNGGSGSNVMNLADLMLTSFVYDGGSGSTQIELPATDQMLDTSLNTGSGSVQVSVANGAHTSLELNSGSGSVNLRIGSNAVVDAVLASGSGSVTIELPAGVPVRIEAMADGSGSFSVPTGLALVDDGGDDERDTGAWESSDYSPGSGITLRFTGVGSGSVSIH